MRERATRLDDADPLARHRDRFHIPPGTIYLDGNSLGVLPTATPGAIDAVLATWSAEAVLGWEHWIDSGVVLGDLLAPLIGASGGSVAVGDQTSVNLYKLADAALADGRRPSILTDAGNFPSDRYVLEAVARRNGGRLVVAPEDPTPETLIGLLDDDVGLVSMSHVSYRTGHLHDGAALTTVAHDHGARMLWDLAHSAGAVPVDLEGWGADMAVGCTYKYLNGGPGSPGFLYVRPDLHTVLEQPIHGWFGHRDMFGFDDDYVPDDSIRRFLVGTPSIVAMAATRVGIETVVDAGIAAIRAKGIELGELFLEAIGSIGDEGLTLVSPRNPHHRGSHVAVRHPDAFAVSRALRAEGVIVDFRAPDVLRFGFAPLYLRFTDVVAAAAALDDVLASGSHRAHTATRHGVT